MDNWYTLYTKPNAEYQVAAVLQQRGLLTYLPEIATVTKQNKRIKKPFFPCYLFIQTDFKVVGYSSIQWTPGLRRVIGFAGQPVALENAVIDYLRSKLDQIEGQGGLPAHSFQPGETVRITAGPFCDMLAIFEGPTTPSERVQVLLNILGHASRVQIDADQLQKAAPGVEAPVVKRPRRTRGRNRPIRV